MKSTSANSLLLVFCALLFCAPASAGTFVLTFSGELETTDVTFINPDGKFEEPTFFDIFEITVPESGMYHLLSYYAGDVATGDYLDGFLAIYVGSPGSSIAFGDNYSAGSIESLGDFDSNCIGQNCSGFSVQLAAGATYTVVQTSFAPSPQLFGSHVGPYETTIIGPGDITTIPLPAAFWLFGTALSAMGFLRR